MYVADRRLYLTEDKSRVVEEGDPAAYYLYATPGAHIPVAEARELGLVADEGEPRAAQEEAQPADQRERGQATTDAGAADADGATQGKAVGGPPENKAAKQGASKSKPLGADMQSKER